MNVQSFEAVVENGQIRLPGDVRLPDKTTVYVVVPLAAETKPARVASPRLVHASDAERFQMEVVREKNDAGL